MFLVKAQVLQGLMAWRARLKRELLSHFAKKTGKNR
jgi:hypothetical protein